MACDLSPLGCVHPENRPCVLSHPVSLHTLPQRAEDSMCRIKPIASIFASLFSIFPRFEPLASVVTSFWIYVSFSSSISSFVEHLSCSFQVSEGHSEQNTVPGDQKPWSKERDREGGRADCKGAADAV